MNFEKLQNSLEGKGYKVSSFATKEEAARYLAESINGQTVGFGGSMTLEEMGLYEKLSEKMKVYWHWRIPEGKTGADMLQAAKDADVYFSSDCSLILDAFSTS